MKAAHKSKFTVFVRRKKAANHSDAGGFFLARFSRHGPRRKTHVFFFGFLLTSELVSSGRNHKESARLSDPLFMSFSFTAACKHTVTTWQCLFEGPTRNISRF